MYKMKLICTTILFLCFISLISITSQELPVDLSAVTASDEGAEGEAIPVALLNFDFTTEVGLEKTDVVYNEIAVALDSNPLFAPASLNQWASAYFLNKKAGNILDFVEMMRKERVNVAFVCHGNVFKSGSKYGLKIAMYPIDKSIEPTYYFRTFSNFYSIKKVAEEIVHEMTLRATSMKSPSMSKEVFLNNFKLIFSEYIASKQGTMEKLDRDFIQIQNTEFHKNDNFINELFLYNFHVSNLFTVYNNNVSKYIDSSVIPKTADYIMSGIVELSKKDIVISVNVRDLKKEAALHREHNIRNKKAKKKVRIDEDEIILQSQLSFTRVYSAKIMDLDLLYKSLGEYTKDIMYAILDDRELGNLSILNVEPYYGGEKLYLDNRYIGKNQKMSLLVPKTNTTITRLFAKNWDLKENVNVLPYQVNTVDKKLFKLSLGVAIMYDFLLHPELNETAIFLEDSNGLEYSIIDVLDGYDTSQNISSQVGGGFDFTLESPYFGLSTQVFFKFGEYYRTHAIRKNNLSKNLSNSEELKSVSMDYTISKFSFMTDFNFLPHAILLPDYFPVRLFAGMGFYFSCRYNQFDEVMSGYMQIDSQYQPISITNSELKSASIDLGVFPEVGLLYYFLKFNLKVSFAYYLNFYQYNIFSDTNNARIDSYNTNSFVFKVGVGYYVN